MLWLSMALAALPDADLVPALIVAFPANPFSAGLFDADTAVLYHRSWTHALPILLAAGFSAGIAGARLLGAGKAYCRWLAVAVLALLSHSLLDMANGPVRFWLPFSDDWVGRDNAVEGSPLIILPLLSCFLTNHPPRFANRRGLSTLTALNMIGKRLSEGLGKVLSPRLLAALVLGGIGIGLAAMHLARIDAVG
jgi:Predicted membrane-bound metal-dependent hydrolase (DUF457).